MPEADADANDNYRLHPFLVKLRDQINARWPKRSKASDGWVGDLAHKGRKSDHNPDEYGFVNAIDITNDPAGGCDGGALAEALRLSRDPRIKYVIFNKRIFNSTVQPWIWRPYNGTNPHSKHVHISVGGTPVNWRIE